MAEQTGTPEAQAATDVQPQAGNPPAQEADAQQPETGGADSEGTPDIAVLQRELSQARREAAQYRTKVRSYEDAQKTDAEKNAERIAELERELASERTRGQEQRLQMASFNTARKLGFRNPEIAHRLLGSDVEFADDGTPKNVESLLKRIAESEPYLVSTSTPDYGGGPRGTSPNAGVDMNARIRRAAGRAS